jgi:hypothetical protein
MHLLAAVWPDKVTATFCSSPAIHSRFQVWTAPGSHPDNDNPKLSAKLEFQT